MRHAAPSPAPFAEIERIKMQNAVCWTKDAHRTFKIGSEANPVISVR